MDLHVRTRKEENLRAFQQYSTVIWLHNGSHITVPFPLPNLAKRKKNTRRRKSIGVLEEEKLRRKWSKFNRAQALPGPKKTNRKTKYELNRTVQVIGLGDVSMLSIWFMTSINIFTYRKYRYCCFLQKRQALCIKSLYQYPLYEMREFSVIFNVKKHFIRTTYPHILCFKLCLELYFLLKMVHKHFTSTCLPLGIQLPSVSTSIKTCFDESCVFVFRPAPFHYIVFQNQHDFKICPIQIFSHFFFCFMMYFLV